MKDFSCGRIFEISKMNHFPQKWIHFYQSESAYSSWLNVLKFEKWIKMKQNESLMNMINDLKKVQNETTFIDFV